jgi:hypothetical protein
MRWGRAKVPELVEVHLRTAGRRANRAPVVAEAPFREAPDPRSQEQPWFIDPPSDVRERLTCRRREGHYALVAVLRRLKLAGTVEVPYDPDLIVGHVLRSSA